MDEASNRTMFDSTARLIRIWVGADFDAELRMLELFVGRVRSCRESGTALSITAEEWAAAKRGPVDDREWCDACGDRYDPSLMTTDPHGNRLCNGCYISAAGSTLAQLDSEEAAIVEEAIGRKLDQLDEDEAVQVAESVGLVGHRPDDVDPLGWLELPAERVQTDLDIEREEARRELADDLEAQAMRGYRRPGER